MCAKSRRHEAQCHPGDSAAMQPLAMVPGNVCDVRRSSGSEVQPRLARPTHGRRLRVQTEASKELLDHPLLQGGGNDLELPSAVVRAARHVDVKALEQPQPAGASRPDLGGLGLRLDGYCSIGGRLGCSVHRLRRHIADRTAPRSTTALDQADRKVECQDPAFWSQPLSQPE
jgi:hypothetical protein